MIDMSAYKGRLQKIVTPLNKPSVKSPEFKEIKFLEVHAETDCFITPDEPAKRAVEYLNIEEGKKYLEPQAGTGQLVKALLNAGVDIENITAVEKNYDLCKITKERFNMPVIQQCFLEFAEETDELYDYIIMNPPFKKNASKHHVNAAYKLLNKGGRIIAIVPSTFKHDLAYEIEFLSSDTFSNTKVHTKIIEIEKE